MADHQMNSPQSARSLAHEAISRVVYKGQAIDTFFDGLIADLETADRAFARALLYGTLRNYGAIDRVLADLLKDPLPDRARRADITLRMGLAEILVIGSAAHALVNEAVIFVKSSKDGQRYGGLVNAILRRALREEDALKAKMHHHLADNFPIWIKERFLKRWGGETVAAIAKTVAEVPALDLTLVDARQTDRWAEKLGGTSLMPGHVRVQASNPVNLEGFADGAWFVQDIAASLPVRMMPLRPGDHILDMCAAPGGKAMQLVSLGAEVTALDRSKPRLKRLLENMARIGKSVSIETSDALKHQSPKPYDHILIDAPCTALGTLRRNPDILHIRCEEDIQGTAKIQARLLDHAVTLLKPGGTLLYAVCSMEPEEGIDQINAFLERTKGVGLMPITADEIDPLSAEIMQEGCLITRPDLLAGGMDGFFIAKMQKQAKN